jgi:phenylacetate-coenzyme A ligase PaaK-like adenylate-forming protein
MDLIPITLADDLISSGETDAAKLILLRATLQNAWRTPFYREHWGGMATAMEFESIPIVDKAELMRAGPAAQVRTAGRFGEKFTSGTNGEPFLNIVGEREQCALAALHRKIQSRYSRRKAPRGVCFKDTHVAFSRTIPSPIRFHNLSIYGKGTFDFALKTIENRIEERGVEPQCSILVAGDRILRAFTSFVHQRRSGPAHSHLRHLITYSNYLSRRSRMWYSDVWGVEVTDRYGLSEAVGGATQEATCGWYHFDPVVIPEVVGHRSRQPMREGVGVLVLTTLFPFQECQPLIRYWTGDLVEVTHSRSSRPGRMAIRPLGRIQDGVPAPDGDDWLITPDKIFAALDDCDVILREPLFRDSPNVEDPHWCGLPRFTLDVARAGPTAPLVVTLSFSVRNPLTADQIIDSIVQGAGLSKTGVGRDVIVRHAELTGQ